MMRARRNSLIAVATGSAPDPLPYLVDGLLHESAFGLVFGLANCGKSLLMVDLLCSVATGTPWMGMRTARGQVVYAALEGTLSLPHRLHAWANDRGLPDTDFLHTMGSVTLTDSVDVDHLIDNIKDYNEKADLPVRLVVIDTLSQAIAGADENSQAVMSEVVRQVDKIRNQTGAAVILVHHPSKNNPSEPRGNTVLIGAVDTCIKVSATGGVRVCEVTKQRHAAIGEGFRFRIKQVSTSAVTEMIAPSSGIGKQASGSGNPDDQIVLSALQSHAKQGENGDATAADGEVVVPVSIKGFRKFALAELFPGMEQDAKRQRINRSLGRLSGSGAFHAMSDSDNILVRVPAEPAAEDSPSAIIYEAIEDTY
jgi:hypothetical protein